MDSELPMIQNRKSTHRSPPTGRPPSEPGGAQPISLGNECFCLQSLSWSSRNKKHIFEKTDVHKVCADLKITNKAALPGLFQAFPPRTDAYRFTKQRGAIISPSKVFQIQPTVSPHLPSGEEEASVLLKCLLIGYYLLG